jgi:hypothetical protein
MCQSLLMNSGSFNLCIQIDIPSHFQMLTSCSRQDSLFPAIFIPARD